MPPRPTATSTVPANRFPFVSQALKSISAVPEKNLARVYGPDGVRAECVASFPERFREAYLLEMQEFVDCVRTGRTPGTTVYDGVRSTAVGYATTEAWRTGRPVQIHLP